MNKLLGLLSLVLLIVASSTATFGQVCTAPPANLAAWYPAEGNASDIQSGVNGVIQGGVSFVPGEVGQGFSFNSNADRITIPANAIFDLNNPGFTVDFWVKGTKNQPQALFDLIEKSHGFIDNTGWTFQGDSTTGLVLFAVGNGATFVLANGTTDVLDGHFHHIAGTWDTNFIRIYIDGVQQGSAALTNPANNTRPVNFGFAAGGGTPQRFFRGITDEYHVFDRGLSASEIQSIAQSSIRGLCRPDLSITKQHTSNFMIGVPASYLVKVANNGAGPTYGPTTVIDSLPIGMIFGGLGSATSPGWNCTSTGGINPGEIVTCNNFLPIGGSGSQIEIRFGDCFGGPVTNTATVSTPGDGTTGAKVAADTTNVDQTTTTTLTSTPNPSASGRAVSFTATVTPFSPGSCPQGGSIAFKDGNTTIGVRQLTAAHVTFATALLAPGAHAITAVYSGDGNFFGSTSPVLTQFVGTGDLAVSESTGNDPALSGGTLTYTIQVSNGGPDTAIGVNLTDQIPTGATFQSFSPATNCILPGIGGSGTINCQLGDFTPGTVKNFTLALNVTATAGQTITNTATVGEKTIDPNLTNNTISRSVGVFGIGGGSRGADLAINESIGQDPAMVGSFITYQIQISSGGPDNAENVKLMDLIPNGTVFDSFSPTTGCVLPLVGGVGTLTCSLGTFTPGTTRNFNLRLQVTGDTTSITNKPTVTSSTGDPIPGNNTAIRTIGVSGLTGLSQTVVPAGSRAFVLTVNGSNFVNGTTVQWNGQNRATTFVSSSQVRIVVNAADIARPGTVNITAIYPGSSAVSNAKTLQVVGNGSRILR